MGKTDSIQVPIFTTESPDYEVDFHAWSMEQASRLRLLRIPGIDSENLAEEIESLGRSDKREIVSRCEILLMHLLKWRYQPALRGNSCRGTIMEQRHSIEALLAESPSLRPTLPAVVDRAYSMATRKAALETHLPGRVFPTACEWTPDQVLDQDFLPDA